MHREGGKGEGMKGTKEGERCSNYPFRALREGHYQLLLGPAMGDLMAKGRWRSESVKRKTTVERCRVRMLRGCRLRIGDAQQVENTFCYSAGRKAVLLGRAGVSREHIPLLCLVLGQLRGRKCLISAPIFDGRKGLIRGSESKAECLVGG